MHEFLIDNIFAIFGGRDFQQTVGILMGTNCAPLIADLFLYSYEADFIQGLLMKLSRSFNLTFRYIDDVLSLNNSRFCDFVDRIYLIEVEIKDTIDTASYLDLHLEIDSNRTKLYDKRDGFNFPPVNFPFICSNIPAAPVYGVDISQLIRYSRACGSYKDFLDRGLLLTWKLLNQGFLLLKLKSLLRTFYGCHHDLGDRYGISVSRVCSTCRKHFQFRSFPYSWLVNGFVTRLTRWVLLVEQELPTLLEHMSSPTGFSGVRVTRSLVLCVCLVYRCLSFYTFYLAHCVVCSSSLYGFWLSLWYIQTLLMVYVELLGSPICQCNCLSSFLDLNL
jgi:hypothetical protein